MIIDSHIPSKSVNPFWPDLSPISSHRLIRLNDQYDRQQASSQMLPIFYSFRKYNNLYQFITLKFSYIYFIQYKSSSIKMNPSSNESQSRTLFEINDPMLNEVSNEWEQYYTKLKNSLSGTDYEKEEIIRKRILKFFGEYRLNSQSYFFPRKDIDLLNPNIRLIDDRLIVFGIDYLTKDKILNYFQGFEFQVKFIDDSHCLLAFSNNTECLRLISAKNKLKINFQSGQDVLEKGEGGWIELQPYYEILFERKIMVRYQSNFDIFQNTSNQNQIQYSYLKAKKRFLKHLTDTHNERKKSTFLEDKTYPSHKKSYDHCCSMKNHKKVGPPNYLSNIYEDGSYHFKRQNHQNRCYNCMGVGNVRFQHHHHYYQNSRERRNIGHHNKHNHSRSRSRQKSYYLKTALQFEKYCQKRNQNQKSKPRQESKEKKFYNLETQLNLNPKSKVRASDPFASDIPAIQSKSSELKKRATKLQEDEDSSILQPFKNKDDYSALNVEISRCEI